jgi:hypothetical protein
VEFQSQNLKGRENLDTKPQKEEEYSLEPEKINMMLRWDWTDPGYGNVTDKRQYGKGLSISV